MRASTDATVQVNGSPQKLGAANLSALLTELGYDVERQGIAVALNDEVVPRGEWSNQHLAPGDRIEVITAVQGG